MTKYFVVHPSQPIELRMNISRRIEGHVFGFQQIDFASHDKPEPRSLRLKFMSRHSGLNNFSFIPKK